MKRSPVRLTATDSQIGRQEPAWAAVLAGLSTVIDGEVERRKTYTLKALFPDCTTACRDPKSLKRKDHGALCRRLYRKHVAWMNAGRDYAQRLFMAGNRCLTPWSAIQTGHATRQIGELIGARAFDVRTWDGGSRRTSQGTGVFLKGIEPAFRLHLDNGEVFDCSRRHRVLTRAGWLSLEQLIHRASGQRYWRTDAGCPANYGGGDRPDGAPRQGAQDTSASSPHRAADVLPHSPSGGHGDAAAHTAGRTHVFRDDASDAPRQLAALCDSFVDPSAELDARWPTSIRRALFQWSCASGREREAAGGGPHPPFVTDLVESARRAPRSTWRARHRAPRGWQQWPSGCASPAWQEFWEAAPYSVMFCPSTHPLFIGNGRIIAVVPLGCQPILDFTVKPTHNYELGGVIHHNTGKTKAAGFEVACHLTGLYPLWWRGRTFPAAGEWWAVGKSSTATRDIVQKELVGPGHALRTGLIPPHTLIGRPTMRGGTPGAVDTALVRHVSGGISTLTFKSYDQRRQAFEGTKKAGVWLDEEPPEDVAEECAMRTMGIDGEPGGITVVTFTPLQGITPYVQQWLDGGDLYTAEGLIVPARQLLGVAAEG